MRMRKHAQTHTHTHAHQLTLVTVWKICMYTYAAMIMAASLPIRAAVSILARLFASSTHTHLHSHRCECMSALVFSLFTAFIGDFLPALYFALLPLVEHLREHSQTRPSPHTHTTLSGSVCMWAKFKHSFWPSDRPFHTVLISLAQLACEFTCKFIALEQAWVFSVHKFEQTICAPLFF